MFSHIAREPGTHQCIGSRANDPAIELQDLGGPRAIAATAINSEVPISAETICLSIKTKAAYRFMSVTAVNLGRRTRGAGRQGAPRLVAIAYFACAEQDQGQQKNIYDYYRALGDERANRIAGSIHIGARGVKAAAESFAAIGADELIMHPAVAHSDEIARLAEAVL